MILSLGRSGSFWAGFSVAWSFVVAYSAAVIVYQIGTFSANPGAAAGWLLGTVAVAGAFFAALILWGKRQPDAQLIPLKVVD